MALTTLKRMVIGSIIGGWKSANALSGGRLNKFVVRTGAGLLGKGLKCLGKEHWAKGIADVADGFSNEVLDSSKPKEASAQKQLGAATNALREGAAVKSSTPVYTADAERSSVGHTRRYGNIKGKVDLRYL